MTDLSFCQCGCGGLVNPGYNYIKGHNRCKTPWRPKTEAQLCSCGCGELAKPGNKFIDGHQNRGNNNPMKNPDTAKKISNILTGVSFSIERLAAHRRDRRKEKPPLPNGWETKTGKMATNKDCGAYLGNIAEQLLSTIFPDVQVMPQGNPGYDFICNRGLKIDVKSSTILKDRKHAWVFAIDRNEIPDYFICIAFDNRKNFNILHWWIIPGHVLNDRYNVNISKSTLHKWSQYEQSIDKILVCCNEMKAV